MSDQIKNQVNNNTIALQQIIDSTKTFNQFENLATLEDDDLLLFQSADNLTVYSIKRQDLVPFFDFEAFEAAVNHSLLKSKGTGVNSTYVSSVVVGGTTFAQPAVFAEIKSDQGYFDIHYLGASGVTVNDLAAASTYVYLDNAGDLQQQTSTPTRLDWTRKVFLMRIAVDLSTNLIIGFEYLNNPIGNYSNSIRDIYRTLLAQGVPFKEEQIVTGRATDLGFDISAGSLTEFGGTGDIYNPNTKEFDLIENADFFLATRTAFDAGGNTDLPKFWDNNGTLTALGSTTFVGHRLYRFSNGNVVIQYGQGNYANIVLAKSGVLLEEYVLNPILKNATFFGWWFIEDTATNTGGTTLTDFIEYTIGIQGGSSNSLSGCLLKGNNLSDLLDVPAAVGNLGLNTNVTFKKASGYTDIKTLEVGDWVYSTIIETDRFLIGGKYIGGNPLLKASYNPETINLI